MNDLKGLENKRPASNGFAIGFNVTNLLNVMR